MHKAICLPMFAQISFSDSSSFHDDSVQKKEVLNEHHHHIIKTRPLSRSEDNTSVHNVTAFRNTVQEFIEVDVQRTSSGACDLSPDTDGKNLRGDGSYRKSKAGQTFEEWMLQVTTKAVWTRGQRPDI
eukprot:scaffold7464_cov267-Chaetoceros_neogracile.AAC.3